MHKDVLAASHFEGDFGQHFISFPYFVWQNMLLYRNTFPKMCRLSYKLWRTKNFTRELKWKTAKKFASDWTERLAVAIHAQHFFVILFNFRYFDFFLFDSVISRRTLPPHPKKLACYNRPLANASLLKGRHVGLIWGFFLSKRGLQVYQKENLFCHNIFESLKMVPLSRFFFFFYCRSPSNWFRSGVTSRLLRR